MGSGDFDNRDTFWKKLRCWLFHGGVRIHYIDRGYTVENCNEWCYQKTTPHGKPVKVEGPE